MSIGAQEVPELLTKLNRLLQLVRTGTSTQDRLVIAQTAAGLKADLAALDGRLSSLPGGSKSLADSAQERLVLRQTEARLDAILDFKRLAFDPQDWP